MKKPFIYMAVIAALVVFGALAAVYQSKNPGRIIPAKAYTESKAKCLVTDYRQAAERFGIDKDKRGSTVYAVMAECPTPELEKNGVTAVFFFTDIEGRRTHTFSDGSEVPAGSGEEKDTGELIAGAARCFDDTFTRASNSDYGAPDHGYVKLYVHRGDGVYFRLYKEDETPADLSELIETARDYGDKS